MCVIVVFNVVVLFLLARFIICSNMKTKKQKEEVERNKKKIDTLAIKQSVSTSHSLRLGHLKQWHVDTVLFNELDSSPLAPTIRTG